MRYTVPMINDLRNLHEKPIVEINEKDTKRNLLLLIPIQRY